MRCDPEGEPPVAVVRFPARAARATSQSRPATGRSDICRDRCCRRGSSWSCRAARFGGDPSRSPEVLTRHLQVHDRVLADEQLNGAR